MRCYQRRWLSAGWILEKTCLAIMQWCHLNSGAQFNRLERIDPARAAVSSVVLRVPAMLSTLHANKLIHVGRSPWEHFTLLWKENPTFWPFSDVRRVINMYDQCRNWLCSYVTILQRELQTCLTPGCLSRSRREKSTVKILPRGVSECVRAVITAAGRVTLALIAQWPSWQSML